MACGEGISCQESPNDEDASLTRAKSSAKFSEIYVPQEGISRESQASCSVCNCFPGGSVNCQVCESAVTICQFLFVAGFTACGTCQAGHRRLLRDQGRGPLSLH